MVKVFEGTKNEYYIDGYLKANLDIAKKVVHSDWDMVFVTDGTEGGGKSVFTQTAAYYCDPTLTLDRIVFTPKQFKDAVKNASKFQAVIYDEAYGGLNARASMSRVNTAIVKMLTEIRRKNLFIFIVLPTFFDLDKYVAIWRSRALFHIYADEKWTRGMFAFYGKEEKKKLYLLGKKFYDYNKPSPVFRGRFTNHFVVDKKAYDNKKVNSTMKEEDDLRISLLKMAKELRAQIAINLSSSNIGLTQVQQAAVLGVSTMSIHRYLNNKGLSSKVDVAEGEDDIEEGVVGR